MKDHSLVPLSMLNKILRGVAGSFPAVLAGALTFCAQVGPDEAASNLVKWPSKIGLHDLPIQLTSPTTGAWVLRISLLVLAFYALAIAFYFLRKGRSRDKELLEELSLHIFEGEKLRRDIEAYKILPGLPGRFANSDAPFHAAIIWQNAANQIVLKLWGQAATTEFMTILIQGTPGVDFQPPIERTLSQLNESIGWLRAEMRMRRHASPATQ